ncbi:hypothetical protein AGR7C_Cc260337 [Agrobacterium deltaense Zutra 3/1]|uniref:Uncharacterized protein n=1 Tax=Agrobacterium deltaense Zutra 3/1 TaxID=1183427 RepID=A0A1S7QAU3_9HYPH|nr:hypothetical protein AGR7C_Cc260337 [Agrobacterium deltaense Zutra 3/1]
MLYLPVFTDFRTHNRFALYWML